MLNVSIPQALDVYSDLVRAMNGNASHGSEAEIYAYRLLPNIPSRGLFPSSDPSKLSTHYQAEINKHHKAAIALYELCTFFEQQFGVKTKINGWYPIQFRENCANNVFVFDHRVMVSVSKK